jgi:MFS family permease
MPLTLISSRFRTTFRALRHRNFRLFLIGQAISLIGTWMQRVAAAWLVYRLTGSAWLLGVIGFCSQAPTIPLGPLAGMAADRLDRYKILLWTQILEMVQALALAGLVLGGVVHIWHLVVLSLVLGVISTFEMPARQALVIRMIDDKTDLGNAIALHSSVFNGARLVGPSVAGLLIAAFGEGRGFLGEGMVFLLNGLSFLAVIWALLAMRVDRSTSGSAEESMSRHLIDGVRYAFGTPAIRAILTMLALFSLLGIPYAVLMPIIADRVYHGGAHALGLLLGAAGCGALIGAVMLAGRRTTAGLNRRVPLAGALFGAALLLLGLTPPWWLALALLFVIGWCGIYQVAASNTILQTLVDETQRGRVMSYFSMAVLGVMPLGNLLAGATAEWLGAPATLALGGGCCLICALVLRRGIRRIVLPATMPGVPDPARPSDA